MNTGRTHFEKGNRAASNKKGKQHKSTLIKINLQERIGDLDNLLYNIAIELLNSRNIENRKYAWKELLKYRLHQMNKSEHSFPKEDIEKEYKTYLLNLPRSEYNKKCEEANKDYMDQLSPDEIKERIAILKKVLE